MDNKKEPEHEKSLKKEPVKAAKEPEKNLTLAQKLKLKVDEALDSEKELKPTAAERVNQIFNDAIAGMPPAKLAPQKPEFTMAEKLKIQIDACVANSDITPELAAKLNALLADVEAAYKTEPVPAAPVQPV